MSSIIERQNITEQNDLSSSVTWVSIPDAYVSLSAITQHQASLTITESQISDLGSYLTSVAFSDIDAGAVLTSLEAFADVDNQLMTAAAIDDLIESKGYITSETDSQTLSWNGSTGEITISGGNTIDLDGRYSEDGVAGITTNSNFAFSSWVSTADNSELATNRHSYLHFVNSSNITWEGDSSSNIMGVRATVDETALTITESQISDLGSYLTDAPSDGNTYGRNNGACIQVSGGSATLSGLTDTNITTPSVDQILHYDGSNWVNKTLFDAGIAGALHNHDTADITSGTFADARISQSSVQQHIDKTYIDGLNVDADTVDSLHGADLVQIAGTQTITGAKTFSDLVTLDGTTAVLEKVTANGNSRWMQQDGTGRVHWYWNTDGGTSPTFHNANEDAGALSISATNNGSYGAYLQFRSADGTTAGAGDPITWTTVLLADMVRLQYKGQNIWHGGNDGASSGLDADLLDGQHGTYYLDYNNFTNTPSIPTVDDTAYGVSWNGNTDAPTKNAVYDKIETLSVGGLNNVVEDTTPQLGGTLDANGNTIDMGTNLITDTKVGQWDTAYGWGDWSTGVNKAFVDALNIDADTLDGRQGSDYVINAAVANTNTGSTSLDLNAHYTGIFYANTGSNRPPVGNSHVISQFLDSGSGYSQQIAGRQDEIYFRHEENGVWGSWNEFYHTGNLINPVVESDTPGSVELDPKISAGTNVSYNSQNQPTLGMAAITSGMIANKMAFWRPDLIEESTNNGTSWSNSSYTNEQIDSVMCGLYQDGASDPNKRISILSGVTDLRITWDADNYVFLNYLYLYHTQLDSGATLSVKVEKEEYDGASYNWETVTEVSSIQGWPQHSWIPHEEIRFTPTQQTDRSRKVRITFSFTGHTNGYRLYNINWYGTYPANNWSKDAMYTWDENGVITLRDGLHIPGDLSTDGQIDFDLNGLGLTRVYSSGTDMISTAPWTFWEGTIFFGSISIPASGYTKITPDSNTHFLAVSSAGGQESIKLVDYDDLPGAGAGSGDVTKVGTPVNNQLAVWTGDGTLEGTSNILYDDSGAKNIFEVNNSFWELNSGTTSVSSTTTGGYLRGESGSVVGSASTGIYIDGYAEGDTSNISGIRIRSYNTPTANVGSTYSNIELSKIHNSTFNSDAVYAKYVRLDSDTSYSGSIINATVLQIPSLFGDWSNATITNTTGIRVEVSDEGTTVNRGVHINGTENSTRLGLDVTGGVASRFQGNVQINGGKSLFFDNVATRAKICLWDVVAPSYAIGFDDGYNYGFLGSATPNSGTDQYAMTFTNDATGGGYRGWWWGLNSATNSQGSMSLNTLGDLYIERDFSMGGQLMLRDYGSGTTQIGTVNKYLAADASGNVIATDLPSNSVTYTGSPAAGNMAVFTGTTGEIEPESGMTLSGSVLSMTGINLAANAVTTLSTVTATSYIRTSAYLELEDSGNYKRIRNNAGTLQYQDSAGTYKDFPQDAEGWAYSYIYGERGAGASVGNRYAFGNGATGTSGVKIGNACQLYAVSVVTDTSSTGTVDVFVNGTSRGSVTLTAQTENIAYLATPYALSAGDEIYLEVTSGTISGISTATATLRNAVFADEQITSAISTTLYPVGTDVATGTDLYVFQVPNKMDGLILNRCKAMITGSAGSGTGNTTISVNRKRSGTTNSMLSTNITISTTATESSSYTINTTYDDVATDDLIILGVPTVPTTAPDGLNVVLEFTKP